VFYDLLFAFISLLAVCAHFGGKLILSRHEQAEGAAFDIDVTTTVANLQASLGFLERVIASMTSARNKVQHLITVFIGSSKV